MSGTQDGEFPNGAEDRKAAMDKHSARKSPGKQRVNDVARALRSIYDDTLRESVPEDFKDLLGKLN